MRISELYCICIWFLFVSGLIFYIHQSSVQSYNWSRSCCSVLLFGLVFGLVFISKSSWSSVLLFAQCRSSCVRSSSSSAVFLMIRSWSWWNPYAKTLSRDPLQLYAWTSSTLTPPPTYSPAIRTSPILTWSSILSSFARCPPSVRSSSW